MIKALWGTAWDFFLGRTSCDKDFISKMVGESVEPIFITNDMNLYKLISPKIDTSIKFNSTRLAILTENDYPPHLSDEEIEKINEQILKISMERIQINNNMNIEKIMKIKDGLEKNLA